MSESESADTFDEEEFSFWLRSIYTILAICVILWPFYLEPFFSALFLYFKTVPDVVVDGTFVDRPELQAELLTAVNHPESNTVLVYGDRGGGKTLLVEHAFKGRRGIFIVTITENTHKDAQAQMLELISRELHIFGLAHKVHFIKKVFSSCGPVQQPVVVVSLETKCPVDVLEAVITVAKNISYDSRHKKHPRIVVDLSASRAAIEAGTQLHNRRVVGIHVGRFLPAEALQFVSDSIPEHFNDPLRRKQLAQLVIDKFDSHVLTLKSVCKKIEKDNPKRKEDVENTIAAAFKVEKEAAFLGWCSFCKTLETELEFKLPHDSRRKIAGLLLEGKQKTSTIIQAIEEKAPAEAKSVTRKDIGVANADADYHPLFIDPFETDISLAGKAVEAALNERLKSTSV